MKTFLIDICNACFSRKHYCTFLAKYNLPFLTAVSLFLAEKRIFLKSKKRNKRYRILILYPGRLGVLDDVFESLGYCDEYELVQWRAKPNILRELSGPILSPYLDNNNYVTSDPAIEATKIRYRQFLKQAWTYLRRFHKIDAVLAPNFGYAVQREFGAALEELGTPFIVLHKENLKSPGRVEFWRYMYETRRGAFSGRKILVYNEIERQLQIVSKVVPPESVTVTGMPRLDRVHAWRRAHAGGSAGPEDGQIVFFAFGKHEKLPTSQHSSLFTGSEQDTSCDPRWSGLSWQNLFETTHRAIVKLAREFPECRVVVKLKGLRDSDTEIIRLLESEGHGGALPPNLQVVTSFSAIELIFSSDIVIGFNSTALLEALAAGKQIVVPRYAEALEPRTKDFAVDLGTAANYANSPEEISVVVSRLLGQRRAIPSELSAQTLQALDRWTGNPDGGAGQRVALAIRQEIEKSHRVDSGSV